MSWKKILIWFGGTLFVLILAMIAFLFTSDLGRFKPQIESAVSTALGRTFAIEGALYIDLGRSTIIEAEDISIANPAWAAHEFFLTIDQAEITLDLYSLWDGPIIVDSVSSTGIKIFTQMSEEHGPNWIMGSPDPEPTEPEKEGQSLILKQLDIRNLEAEFQNPDTSQLHSLDLTRLTQDRNNENMLEIDVEGQLNNYPVSYEGTVGPFDNLISGRNVDFNGAGSLGDLVFDLNAAIDHLARPDQPTIDLRVSGPSLDNLALALNLPAPGVDDFQVTARTRVESDNLDVALQAQLGDNLVNLIGTSKSLSALDNLDYVITASGPDLNAILSFLGQQNFPAEPYSLDGAVNRSGPDLEVIDMTLEIGVANFNLDGKLTRFPDLRDGSVDLKIRGPEIERFNQLIGLKGVAQGPFEMDLSLSSNDEGRNIFDVNVLNSLGQVQVTGSLGSGERYAGTELIVDIEGDSARTLLDGLGVPGFPDEPYQLDTELLVEENGIRFVEGAIANVQDDRLEVSGFVSYDLLADTNIKYRLSGNDLSEFKSVSSDVFDLPAQPYELSGGLRTTAAGFRLDATEGTLGPNRLSLDGLLSAQKGLTGSDLTFSFHGPNLKALIQPMLSADVPALEFQADGHFRALSDQLRLETLEVVLGGLTASGDIHIEMPWTGGIELRAIKASGANIAELIPETERFRVLPNSYELDFNGRWADNSLVLERAQLNVGDASLETEGSLDRVNDSPDTNLNISINVPSLSQLASLDSGPLPDMPLTLSALVQGTTKHVVINNLLLKSGPSDLNGRLELDRTETIPRINMSVTSNRFDWPYFSEDDEEETRPERAADGRLIPDYELQLERLGTINFDVDISAKRVNFKRSHLDNLKILGSLEDSVLKLQRAYAEGADGNIDIRASVQPKDDMSSAVIRLDLNASQLALNLSKDVDVNRRTLPQVNMKLVAQGQGSNVREIAATLNGDMQASSPGGVIPNSFLSVLDAGLLEQIFGTIIPGTKAAEDTKLECYASGLIFENGKVQAQPGAALVTNKVQLVARGSIDLSTEKLDLGFETHPRKAYQANVSELLINPFVKISGTLAKPRPTLDTGRAIIFSGAAAATGGVSILAKGLWDRMSKSDDPCADFMKASK